MTTHRNDQHLLNVHDLAKVYGHGSHAKVALQGLSIRLDAGTTTAIVGESGSGKSTAARIIVGLEDPSAGTVAIAGRQLSSIRSVRERAREVQIVFQDPYQSLDPRLSPARALALVVRHQTGKFGPEERSSVETLLGQVGLSPETWTALPRTLSGGQRQRVAIAKALAVAPKVLILDEATSALDVSVQAQVLRLVKRIQEESSIGIVFITHDLGLIEHVADQTVVLRRGRVVEQGDTARILRDPIHDYTKLLLASQPRLGWDPADIRRAKAKLDELTETDEAKSLTTRANEEKQR